MKFSTALKIYWFERIKPPKGVRRLVLPAWKITAVDCGQIQVTPAFIIGESRKYPIDDFGNYFIDLVSYTEHIMKYYPGTKVFNHGESLHIEMST